MSLQDSEKETTVLYIFLRGENRKNFFSPPFCGCKKGQGFPLKSEKNGKNGLTAMELKRIRSVTLAAPLKAV